MKLRDLFLLTGAAPAFLGFAACSGASSPLQSAMPSSPVSTALSEVASNATKGRHIAFKSTVGLSKAGSIIPLLYHGKTVGRLTAQSHVTTVSIANDVPKGAMLLAKGRKKSAAFPIAHTGKDTAVLVMLTASGKLEVTTASGLKPTATPSTTDPNGTVETEDSDGNVTKIRLTDGGDSGGTLPSDLPFSTALTCTTMTLTPNAGETFSGIKFEENLDDGGDSGGDVVHANDGGSGNGGFKYEGSFDGPLNVPFIPNSIVKLELFQNSEDVLEIEAPISAFGTPTVTPTPCPSAAPSAEPSESPEPSESSS